MPPRSGSRGVAAVTLSVQLAVAVLGTVGMCLERPHTHGGVPAPDCPMHHRQPDDAAVEPADHHHHHGSTAPSSDSDTRIGCRCASDVLSLMLATVAVVSDPAPLVVPATRPLRPSVVDERMIDAHVSPLSPPPRPTLS
jgi:hypothetical protein